MSNKLISGDFVPAAAVRPGVRLWRVLGMVLLLGWFVGGTALLAVRWLVVPQIGAYRQEIAAELSRVSGLPIGIDALEADWSGLRPRLHIAGLSVRDDAGRTALRLERVDATLAWTSLLRLRPYFHRLEITGPAIELRREADGRLVVGGLPVSGEGDDAGFIDWLLAQRRVVIRDARLSWNDVLRNAPTLALTHVEFVLERGFTKRRFALRAQPPSELASMLDVRGEISQFSASDPAQTVGRLYVALGRADLGAWKAWVDDPIALSGQGSVRAWIDSGGRDAASVSADVALDGATMRLGEDLPVLHLARLQGQVSARRSARGFELETRQLEFATDDDMVMAPTDFRLRVDQGDARKEGGAVTANMLDFAVLARVAAHLPLAGGARERLAGFAPRGQVRDLKLEWKGPADHPGAWTLGARFDGIGLNAHDSLPGVGGLSGEIEGNDKEGRFRLDGRDTQIDLPEIFVNSRLLFSTFKADGGWSRRDGRLELALDSASFDNQDAAGTAAGRYWVEPGSAGEIDLSARLTRADGTSVWRYLPRVINHETHDWVRNAIRRATVPDARLRLKGRLDAFPFREGQGQFLVAIKVANARLEYAADWPPMEAIDGEVRFEGPGLTIEAARGKILGATLSKVVARVPDLDVMPSETMTLTGQASGPTEEFLRFVSASPVRDRINGFTDNMRAEGNGTLDLKLVMPLRHVRDTVVSGEYRFAANRLWVVTGLPPLEEAAGSLRFTADQLSIPAARARLFGEPLQLSAATSGDDRVVFKVRGAASVSAAQASMGWPALDHVSGTTAWSTNIEIGRDVTRVAVRTELDGVGSSLPYPFNKSATERMPTAVDLTFAPDGATTLRASVGDRLNAEIERGADGIVRRGGVGLFQPLQMADKGLLVNARLTQLDVDAWRSALGLHDETEGDGVEQASHAVPAVVPGMAVLNLEAGSALAFGQQWHDLKLKAVTDGGGWKASVHSAEAQGDLDWRKEGDGALAARFKHLRISNSEGQQGGTKGAEAESGARDTLPRSLPGLDLKVDRFSIGSVELGRLEMLARNRRAQWWLERFLLIHPDGRLSGNGLWQPGRNPNTQLDFVLETADIGNFTRALGYPDVVRGGRATLGGQLSWRGAPTRIDYPSLNGKLDLDAEKGQFNKLEPGVGRLLGILSLQALPRRISLDFRDVFSQGFAFDRISGSIDVAAGVMHSDNLEIRGPAAQVLMRGTADIDKETQDLRVTVQPTLSESIAVGAAASLINPVAGVVTYLAQKVLSDPVEKLFAFDYSITGNWSDPVVKKLESPVSGAVRGLQKLSPSLPGKP
ncbi:TIGR02099 family protein [Azoarcus sp. L1K30]|uniref:YhdP family protein n=1 Tax=Azoarcus sp. L1K30 TaxID=2820277 RepID=UPI001B827365|nr:YhdP family protein [Azoarcus sp. L1K30]MBR0568539.1 TIGR02099 family protein [Azoarcus sp. L1K30]